MPVNTPFVVQALFFIFGHVTVEVGTFANASYVLVELQVLLNFDAN